MTSPSGMSPSTTNSEENVVNVIDVVNDDDVKVEQADQTVKFKRGRKSEKERIISGKRDWDEWEIVRLIEMWRESEILYNNMHASYYVTHERRAVLDTIAQELDVSIKEIQDKMHSLRTYFGVQKQKMDRPCKDILPGVRWKYYDMLSFLTPSLQTRKPTQDTVRQSDGSKGQSRKRTFPYASSAERSAHASPDSGYLIVTSSDSDTGGQQVGNIRQQQSPVSTYGEYAYGNNMTMQSESQASERTEVVYVQNPDGSHSVRDSIRRISSEHYAITSPGTMVQQSNHSSSPVTMLSDNYPNPPPTPIVPETITTPHLLLAPQPSSMAIQVDSCTSCTPSTTMPSIMAPSSSSSPPETTDVRNHRSDDELFCDMILKSLAKITDEEMKERVKIEVQTLIFNARFKTRLTPILTD